VRAPSRLTPKQVRALRAAGQEVCCTFVDVPKSVCDGVSLTIPHRVAACGPGKSWQYGVQGILVGKRIC